MASLDGDEVTGNIQGSEGIMTSMVENVELYDDGRDQEEFNQGTGNDPFQDAFLAVENVAYHGDEASLTLAKCKRYIVRPYNILLTVIGWRKFQLGKDSTPGYIKCLNFLYPLFIFVMLLFACVAQVFTCFHRTRSVPPTSVGNGYYILSCDDRMVTGDGISYLMILVSYIVAIYTFRVVEPEYLSSLTERVFLSFSDVVATRSRKKPFFILLTILVIGIIFFLVSFVISMTRLFSLRLDDKSTIIAWYTSNESAQNQSEFLRLSENGYTSLHFFLVVISLIGFLFFDLLYIAVTINYCSQCQLLTFYIENVLDKVRNKKYRDLNLASQDIHCVYQSLKILNGSVSIVASLVFFIFLSNIILSYTDMTKPDQHPLNVATGFLNTIQWLVAALFPVLLAARFTASGNELRRLGLEIASRPFYYADTPDLELQFFLNFTESTRYQVNLAFIPMQPSLVLGVCFFFLLFIASGVVIPQVESVNWF